MIKLETKTAVYTACNNGSSSIVTKDGELYMFGKDAIYSDSTCELTGYFKFSNFREFLTDISVDSSHCLHYFDKDRLKTLKK